VSEAHPNVCPFCFYQATHVDLVAGETPIPQAGDVSMCIGCGELSIFITGGGLRRPTAAEAAEHAVDAELVAAKAGWREMVAKFGRPMGGYSYRTGNG
jgi:hypothetical protein